MNDLISRQAAIDAIEWGKTYLSVLDKDGNISRPFAVANNELSNAIDRIKEIPSAQDWTPVTDRKEYKLPSGRTAVFEFDNNGVGKISLEALDILMNVYARNCWIPVTERLPEAENMYQPPEQRYFCQLEAYGERKFCVLSRLKGAVSPFWDWYGVAVRDHEVIAWMPLPEPYEEADRKTEPTISKMEQVKDEPQTERSACDTCQWYNSGIPCGVEPSVCKQEAKDNPTEQEGER